MSAMDEPRYSAGAMTLEQRARVEWLLAHDTYMLREDISAVSALLTAHDALAAEVEALRRERDDRQATRERIHQRFLAIKRAEQAEAEVARKDAALRHLRRCAGKSCDCCADIIDAALAAKEADRARVCSSCRRTLPADSQWHHCVSDGPPYTGVDDGPERSIKEADRGE